MEKLCIFYASKYHLSLILLEYLKNKNTKKYTVNTFLENEIKDEISLLKEKYEIKINSVNPINFENTKEIYKKKIEKTKDMIFIVEGDLNYIKEANRYIKQETKNNDPDSIKIINCFDFFKQHEYFDLIKGSNDKFLYTNGTKTID